MLRERRRESGIPRNKTSVIHKALIRKPSIARIIVAKKLGEFIVGPNYAKRVYLVGSSARRQAKPTSDLDLYVEGARSRPLVVSVVEDFEQRFGLKIDLFFEEDVKDWPSFTSGAKLLVGGTAKPTLNSRSQK